MPSKNKPNGFIVFSQTIKPRLIAEGHNIQSTADLVSAAGPIWQDLDPDEKEYYKEMARKQKPGNPQERPGRRDNMGQLISERVDLEQVRKQRRMKERLEIARQWPLGRDVIYERFYFIAFSLMCDLRTENLPEHLKIIPCEVSVVEYSIESGIDRVLHKFINPGKIPLGQRHNATTRSESTHKIPLEGMAEVGQTYEKINCDIFQFIMQGRKIVPPVFCKASETVAVEGALRWLAFNAGRELVFKKVCEVEGLLLDLDLHLEGRRPNLNACEMAATKLFTSSVYDYERNTRCEYHEKLDLKYCSMAMAKKWSYFMSDYLCPKADVTLTVNHLPAVQDTAGSFQPQQQWQQQQQQQQQQEQQQQQLLVRDNSMHDSSSQQSQQPRTIGRGRAQAMLSSQPRRPGEGVKNQQQQQQRPVSDTNSTRIGRGTGRGSRPTNQTLPSQQISSSRPLPIGRGMTGMKDVLKSLTDSTEMRLRQPGAGRAMMNTNNMQRDKYATSMTAPVASFAPQPPSEWRN
eukprot:gene11153-12325_t